MTGNKFTVQVSDSDTNIGGDLKVQKELSTTGNLCVDGNKFVVTAADGNLASAGNFVVCAVPAVRVCVVHGKLAGGQHIAYHQQLVGGWQQVRGGCCYW